MPDGVLGELFVKSDPFARAVPEHDLAPAADDRVAALELRPEPGDVRFVALLPRRLHFAADRAEPERDLREVGGGRVQVNAEHVVVRNHHLHAGLLGRIPLDRYRESELLLLLPQVGVRQLVDRLVQERRGAHRRFADGELHHLVGGHVVRHALLDREAHEAARQHFGRVVRRRALAVASGHAVDERSPPVADAPPVHGHDLGLGVVLELGFRDEVPRLEDVAALA